MHDEVQSRGIPLKKDTIISKKDDLMDSMMQTLFQNFSKEDKKLNTDDESIFTYGGDANMNNISFRWDMVVYVDKE